MTAPWKDSRYPHLCFCSAWSKMAQCDNDATAQEYAERAKMIRDVNYGAAKPASMDRWHGESCCPSGNPHG